MSLIEMIIALGVATVVMLTLTNFIGKFIEQNAKLSVIEQKDKLIHSVRRSINSPGLLARAAQNNVTLKNCLEKANSAVDCPATDPARPVGISLVGFDGIKLTGPSVQTPVYFDVTGAPCTLESGRCVLGLTSSFLSRCHAPHQTPVPACVQAETLEFFITLKYHAKGKSFGISDFTGNSEIVSSNLNVRVSVKENGVTAGSSCPAGTRFQGLRVDGSLHCEPHQSGSQAALCRVVVGSPSDEGQLVQCGGTEVLTGGGASCGDGTSMGLIHDSYPVGNGWYADCNGYTEVFGQKDTLGGKGSQLVTTYAICCPRN